jgi:hypothetical protein
MLVPTEQLTPREAFERWRLDNGKPRLTELEGLVGVSRAKLYGFLDPVRHARHRPQPSDFGSLATFLNLKTGSRFTAESVREDYVSRGGVAAGRRARVA